MDTSLRQKINKDTISLAFSDTDQMPLIHIMEYLTIFNTYSFQVHGTFSKIDYTLSKNRSPR